MLLALYLVYIEKVHIWKSTLALVSTVEFCMDYSIVRPVKVGLYFGCSKTQVKISVVPYFSKGLKMPPAIFLE